MSNQIAEQKAQEIMKSAPTQEDLANLVVSNQEDYDVATKLLSDVSKADKELEETRKEMTAPILASKKNIDTFFKEKQKPLQELKALIKKKMVAYVNEQEEKARAEEERKQAIRDKANAKREEKGEAPIEAPINIQTEEVVKTNIVAGAKATTTKVWTHEVIDVSKIPQDIKDVILLKALEKGVVDTVIRGYIKMGMYKIDGVNIYQETKIKTS